MDNKVNKTTVILPLDRKQIAPSYAWDQSRNTFPTRYWTEILCEYIYRYGEKELKRNLQQKYKRNLENSDMEKSDNNMHINVLFKKLLFNEKNDIFEELKKKTASDLEKIVVNYIAKILNQMKESKIPNNWSKNIDEWFEYVKLDEGGYSPELDEGEYSIENYETTDFDNIIQKTLLHENTKIIDYKFEEGVTSWNSNGNPQDNKNLEKIGKIGEQIVYALLIKKYGIDNVVWHSQIDKFAPYDIRYFNGKQTKYIEVKSSTRINRINWFISRREIEFYKTKKDDYEIFFVKDIHKKSEQGALIQRIKNANIIINENLIGIKENQDIYITPIKYKGLA